MHDPVKKSEQGCAPVQLAVNKDVAVFRNVEQVTKQVEVIDIRFVPINRDVYISDT
jgi:hypothetical protein